jgi:hypothetical protein
MLCSLYWNYAGLSNGRALKTLAFGVMDGGREGCAQGVRGGVTLERLFRSEASFVTNFLAGSDYPGCLGR